MKRLCSFGERLAGVATIGFVAILGFVVKVKKDKVLTEAYINLLERL